MPIAGNKLANERQQQQQQQVENETLLCTTRYSLVLVSVIFCSVQLLTVAVCMVSWIHRRDIKFKPQKPTLGRLY